jgi:hypothetical protein
MKTGDDFPEVDLRGQGAGIIGPNSNERGGRGVWMIKGANFAPSRRTAP